MSENRFLLVCLLLFGAFVIGAIVLLNVFQPDKVDVEILNRISTPATVIIGAMIVLLNQNRQTTQVKEEVRQIASEQPKSIKLDK